jgi:phage terminase large subunit-like protein
MTDILNLKKEEYLLLKRKKEIQESLPHIYGYKWYTWARKFYESTNKNNLLCAANQISKSSTQIRKCIHWATEPKLWPALWKKRPVQFWYLYPSSDVADIEFYKKWVPEFMPRGEMKEHPNYGWKANNIKQLIHDVEFNTEVTVYFKTYTQNVQNLQTGTVHAIFCDEELPIGLYDELMFRMAATDGYFHMVFTATLGQEFWYRAMERIGTREEVLRDAFKQQVSMYDCMRYEDGSLAPWTEKRINQIKNSCKSDAQILRRVYGRFVKDEGQKFPCFNRENNMIKPHKIEPDWYIYTGVDIGSGGAGSGETKGFSPHPAAIAFVAVQPDYKYGVVFKGWLGVNQVTTAADILDKYRLMRGNMTPIIQSYDWAGKDFATYAGRLGESFTKAEKSHDIGEDMINILFKNKMLDIFDIEELQPLAAELQSVTKNTAKRFAKDDFVDALRYTITNIPWDWSAITDEFKINERKHEELSEVNKRRKFIFEDSFHRSETRRIEEEIEDYNQLLE